MLKQFIISSFLTTNSADFLFFCHLCHVEIMRVSSMVHDHGFSDLDRRRFRSPSPMSSPIVRPNLHGNGFGPWNGMHQEVGVYLIAEINFLF
jgi:hypothetical protein